MKKPINEALIALNISKLKEEINFLKEQRPIKGDTGPQGPTGPQGERGFIGEQGPAGLPGPRGESGLRGPEGPQGPTGPQGPKGDKGDLGPKGDRGDVGPKGDRGDIGLTGPQGLQGEQGPQGEAGPVGPQGPKGDKGDTGPIGLTGPQGAAGPQGPKGDKGEAGDTGGIGPQGPAGPQGPKGERGSVGPQGPKGDKGDTGPQGPAGPPGMPGTGVTLEDVQPVLEQTITRAQNDFNRWRDNINKSLASLGGGGLGERDVVRLIDEKIALIDSISGGGTTVVNNNYITGLDSAGVLNVLSNGSVSTLAFGNDTTINWNAVDGTLNLNYDSVSLQIGQEQHFYAKATEAISTGEVVMFAGAQGDHILISKADTTVPGFIPQWIVGVATQNFAKNEFGYATSFGKVREIKTDYIGWQEGTLLYLDPSNAGKLTHIKPTSPEPEILVAAVTRLNANEGSILVRPTFFGSLNDNRDVYIDSTTISNQDLLLYNSSTSRWENTPLASIFDSVGNVTITGVDSSDVTNIINNFAAAVDRDLIPASNEVYDLGDSNHRWRELWLAGNSIYLNDLRISADSSGRLLLGQVVYTDSGTTVVAGGPVILTSGILDSAFDSAIEERGLIGRDRIEYIDSSLVIKSPITVQGDINTTSDISLKENIENINGALDIVSNMNGVYYNNIGENRRKIGFIAQELETVLPEVVSNIPGGDIKTVSYSNVVAVLVEAVKELRDEVNMLKSKLGE